MKKWKIYLGLRSGVLIVALTLIVFAINRCVSNVREEQQTQLVQNIEDVGEQNSAQLTTLIDGRTHLLNTLATLMAHHADNISEFVTLLRPIAEIYGFKRIGYVQADGLSYSSDGYHKSIALGDSFQRSIQGEIYVSRVIKDSIGQDGEDINVHSVPVYKDNGNIMGVLYATYRTEDFNDLLHVDSFDGEGTSCILLWDGTIIAASVTYPLDSDTNLFDLLNNADESNDAILADIQNQLSENGSAFGQLSGFPELGDIFFYLTPLEADVGREQWYLATIVPQTVLDERSASFLQDINQMRWLLLLLVAVIALAFLWVNQAQKKTLMDSAYRDPLTGGGNYTFFRDKMREEKTVSGAGYVVTLDLRSFSLINRTCGVEKGDQLLREIWGVVDKATGSGELAAHMSGDNYILFLRAADDAALTNRIFGIERELVDLSARLNVPHVVPLFGVCPVQNTRSPEQSCGNANLAKQSIKNRRDRCYAFYDDKTRQASQDRQFMEDDFEPSLQEHRFEVWYQAKFSPLDNRFVGAEALVRWRSKDGELISPGKFIPLFESNGMIAQLDEYVFAEVCRQQHAWQLAGKSVLPVSVNVSRASMYYPDIVKRYLAILDFHKVEPKFVEIEITESAMVDNGEAEKLVEQFRSAGFRVLVDDFGSGYSSLSTLTMRCFDTIKLDKSLVDCIGQADGEMLLDTMIHLAHALGITVTAEGVENAPQVTFLSGLSCDNIQGFYYARPLPPVEYEKKVFADDLPDGEAPAPQDAPRSTPALCSTTPADGSVPRICES